MKILSINGAGTSGYASAVFLAELEKATGKRCYELFDMIAGVSAGAIQAAALSVGMPAELVVNDLAVLSGTVFKKQGFLAGYFKRSKYDSKKLNYVLHDVIGESTMADTKTRLMIHGTRLTSERIDARFYKSWYPSDEAFKLADLATMSSSAPGYFTPFQIGDDVLIDGGIACNNPSMCAIAEAKRLTGNLDHYCLNLMPNESSGYTKKDVLRRHTFFAWMTDIAGICISGNDLVAKYQATQIMGDKYLGIDFQMGEVLDSWSSEVKNALYTRGVHMFEVYGPQVLASLK